MVIYPECDMNKWETTNNCGVVLANADYYYTKEEVDDIIDDIDAVTTEEVQTIVNKATSGKADTSTVNELAEQVRENTQKILSTYTKEETNSLLTSYLSKLEAKGMFANYAKVDNGTLSLNDANITI